MPDDPKELFRLRQELEAEQQKLDASGKTLSGERVAVREARDEWRFMQDKVHAINRKLNELGIEEPEA